MAKWEHRWFGCDSVTGRGTYNHVESCVYVICVCVYIYVYITNTHAAILQMKIIFKFWDGRLVTLFYSWIV